MGAMVSRYDALMERVRASQLILIDGATGSECIRRGVPDSKNGWSGRAALTHPEIVRQIHTDYIELGADLVVSNSFASGRNVLEDIGAANDFSRLNRRAVELAVEARDAAGSQAGHVVVAGGISNWSFSGNRPTLEQLHANTVEQAQIMRDAGAELISLEMMVDLPRMAISLDAVSTVGLPVWVGLSIGPEEGQDPSMLGSRPELREGGLVVDAVELAAGNDLVEACCIMHTDVRLVERGLVSVREAWDGALGAYAHAAAVVDGELRHDGVITPDEYASCVPAWLAAGATMIGGCCGIGPDHLRAVAEVLAG